MKSFVFALALLLAPTSFAQLEGTARPIVNPTTEAQLSRLVPVCPSGTPVEVSGTRLVCGNKSWGTWVNVTGSRLVNRVYRNEGNTGLVVSIAWNSDSSVQVSVDGTNWVDAGGVNWNNWIVSADVIVPPGNYYRAHNPREPAAAVVRRWSELRLPF